jgi:ADP-dependent NAD(P)H-hydrate dehydratase
MLMAAAYRIAERLPSRRVTPLPSIPPRDPTGHKGTFGTVVVIGGCAHRASDDAPGRVMLGGPAFTANAALRAGCGLAKLALPEPLVAPALTIAPSATGIALAVDHAGDLVPHLAAASLDALCEGARCLAIGPGMGVSDGASALVLRALMQMDVPVVADADALNSMASIPDVHRDIRAALVITPHVGEFRRLAQPLGITADPADPATRASAAAALAQKLACVVVLKSSATVVSDGFNTWTHDQPNPVLATAGSGDVLTGVIASLIAQFFRAELAPLIGGIDEPAPGSRSAAARLATLSLFDAARLGVAVHAHAARQWRKSHTDAGMLANDLIERVPAAVQALRGMAT